MKTTNAKHPVFEYILNAIDKNAQQDYNLPYEPTTIHEKLQFVLDTFRKEYDHEIKRRGEYSAFTEWLMGLPTAINIDYTYFDILRLAVEWGSISEDATEKQQENMTNNWFNFIMVKFFQLCRKYDVR
jgi:hypothetical protein